MHHLRYLIPVAVALSVPAAAQQLLMVGDSLNDRIMLYDPVDGSLINEDFIVDLMGAPYGLSTPKEAIQVGGEIWIVDQVEDALLRFDLAGNYLSSIATGLDNIRGGALINGTVYITNDGTGNAAPGESIVMFDTSGNNLGFFPIMGTSAFDVALFNSELVITDFNTDSVDRYDLAGTFLGNLAIQGVGTALNSPESIETSSSGTVLVAGFGAPSGIYEYDATGLEVSYIPTNAGVRAVHELGNGNLMYTASIGVFVVDMVTLNVTDVTPASGASGQNFGLLDPSVGSAVGMNFCGPAVINSTGNSGRMSGNGTAVAMANNLTLIASDLPSNSFGFFLTSQMQGLVTNPGGSQGNLCLGGAIGRYVGPGQIQNSGTAGEISLLLDLTMTPTPTGLVSVSAGETWNFTAWFRDAVGGTATSNFADGLEVVFL